MPHMVAESTGGDRGGGARVAAPCTRLEQWPAMTSTEAQPDGASNGNGSHEGEASPYLKLSREAWADLGHETVSPLSAEELGRLRGLSDQTDLAEVEEVYLPL